MDAFRPHVSFIIFLFVRNENSEQKKNDFFGHDISWNCFTNANRSVRECACSTCVQFLFFIKFMKKDMINQTRKKYSMLFHPVNDLKYDAHDTMTTITPTENMISIFSHFLRRLHDILSSNRNIQRLKRRKRTRNEVASRRCVCCSMHYL